MGIYATLLATLAFSVSVALTWFLASPRYGIPILDYPSERSLHDLPVPRSGGLGILAALVFTLPWAIMVGDGSTGGILVLFGATGFMAAVSFLDDLKGLSPLVRLPAHLVGALALVAGGYGTSGVLVPGWGEISLGFLAVPFSVLFIVWFTNLYNFMDGMDGFAGGVGAIGFAVLAVFGWREAESLFALVALLVSLANLGFLVLNFPPARIFMGDVGAISMGFLTASMSLWGVREDIFHLWVPVLVFSPFIVDATVTLVRRALRREKLWHAHRSHYYQRLVLLGWSHRRTVLVEYLLMLNCGISAIVLHGVQDKSIIGMGLAIWGVIYIGLAVLVGRAERRRLKEGQ